MTPTNQMMTVQGPGYLPVSTFCYVLNYPFIESFDCCLVESYLVESQYFQYFCSESSLEFGSDESSFQCLQRFSSSCAYFSLL